MKRINLASAAIGVALFAAGVGTGHVVLGPVTLSDYARAYFAPGEWRAITTSVNGVIAEAEGSFAKTYWNEVYQDSFRLSQYDPAVLTLWPHPTHLLEVRHSAGTDVWFAIDPIWRPSPAAEIDWSLTALSAPGDTITQGWARVTADSIFACWPIPEAVAP
jgi:hypothetical protein